MRSIRPNKEGVRQALLNQRGIDHPVSYIDVGQKPAIAVGSLLIELQSNVPPKDERLIELRGLSGKWLSIFRRIDTQISDRSAIFKKDGIAIVDPRDSNTFLMSGWRSEGRKGLAVRAAFDSAITGSAEQQSDQNRYCQP